VSSPNFLALRLDCDDSLSGSAEAPSIRQVLAMPANQIAALEAWYRERDMLVEVSDNDYQEPRFSVIG
jgi:hypothetical protein